MFPIASRCPTEKGERVAKSPTADTWTHEHALTLERERELGLGVRSGMPEDVSQRNFIRSRYEPSRPLTISELANLQVVGARGPANSALNDCLAAPVISPAMIETKNYPLRSGRKPK
jgi:hypothetical protein